MVVDEPNWLELNPTSSRYSQQRVSECSREIGVAVGDC
jgi:hypothetical protein